MIKRDAEATLHRYAKGFPVICVTGPRQSGKTTLAKLAFPKKRYFSLEDPDTALLIRSDPRGFLETWPRGLILDEAQYIPELFVYLKTMVDSDPEPGKYIITGSQQFNLMEKVTESLAGRAAFLTLMPFSIAELNKGGVPAEDSFEIMLKGLYPPLYDRDISAYDFYAAYIASYVERDLRQVINVKNLFAFQNFIKLCAGRIGGILNLNSLAQDCGISRNTAMEWISALEINGIVFLLRPYHKNFGKRLIKSPKLYFNDSGLACRLLGIKTREQLFMNPLRGSLFEGFIISEIRKNSFNLGKNPEVWFWRDNTGIEIDCLLENDGKILAMELKSGKTFTEEMANGLKYWRKMNNLSAMEEGCILVYTGPHKGFLNGIKIISWKDAALFGGKT